MNLDKFKKQLQESLITPMTEYMNDCEDCGFTAENIEQCEALMLNYLNALAGMDTPSDEEIMAQVKTVILALNELSEATDYCMIETMEREAICEIIQHSAIECGLTDPEDDITEEWREW